MGVSCSGRFLTGIPVGRAEGEGGDEDDRNESLRGDRDLERAGGRARRDGDPIGAAATTAWINAPDPTVLELEARQSLRQAVVSECVTRSAPSFMAVQGDCGDLCLPRPLRPLHW
jgi:hypothetical protein